MTATRISRHQMWLEAAHVFAKRATCYRASVGAVVVDGRDILSLGYNGPAAGEEHCTGSSCARTPEGGCARSLHAEANALMRCHNCLGATLYCTESPCIICAELIIQRGIVKVIYSREYRDRKPIERLARCGLEVFRLMPNGMLVNPLTNERVDVLSD